MFKPKTSRIEKLSEVHTGPVKQLEELFQGKVNVYIDYANIRPWSSKLNQNIDLKRLNQFLNSFENVNNIYFYNGTLEGDKISRKLNRDAKKIFKEGYKTKPVKIIKHSIDFTSIKPTATDLLEQFIRKCLLKKFEVETIEYLNQKFREMNERGIYNIEDLKCNFDVEIGRDMLLDYERNSIDTFILWSGDSDFYDPLNQLLDDGKSVVIIGTVRRVASELNKLKSKGLFVFEVQKIRNFICWKKQIKSLKNAKEIPFGTSKL